MPKIPTFTSQVRMTAETGQQAPVIQQSLQNTTASAFQPVAKALTDFAVKEKLIQDKAEALDLENQSIIELNTATQQASKFLNKEEANSFLKTESTRIKDKFAAKAKSSSVRNLFNNNYLLEEQKQIYKVDNAVYKNIVQHSNNQKEIKYERLVRDALFGENKLSRETIYQSLVQLENDDLVQDEDTKLKNIALIPRKLDYFTAKAAIANNAADALQGLNDPKQYTNLDVDTLIQLKNEAKIKAAPDVRDERKNYLAALEVGKEIPINEENIKNVLGDNNYKNFKETQYGLRKISEITKQIYTSTDSEGQKLVNSFVPSKENFAEDLMLKQKLISNLKKKQELQQKDPASLVFGHNDNVKEKFNDYDQEQDPKLKSEKHKIFISSMYEEQKKIGVLSENIKIIPVAQSKNMVSKYNESNPEQKILFLQSLENDYGDLYGKAILQLSKDGLPMTAELGSYFGDVNLATQMISIDTKEERTRLDNFLSKSGIKKNEIKAKVMEDLQDFRKTVMTGNPFDTSLANKKLENIEDVMTYLAINKLSTGQVDINQAVRSSTEYITSNFVLKDTYHIPKIFNNKKLSEVEYNFISDKADIIKEKYLESFNAVGFKSSNKNVSEKEINDSMLQQMKTKGVWLNSADGEGIVFAVKFKNGSFGLVENQDGDLLKIRFDDMSFNLPGTGKNGKDPVILEMTEKDPIITNQTGA